MSLFQEDAKKVHQFIRANLPLDPKKICTSVPLPYSEKPGYSAIYRNKFSADGLITRPHPSLGTLFDLHELAARSEPNSPCFGVRHKRDDGTFGPYEWNTYQEVYDRKVHFGSGVFFILQNNPYRTNLPVHQKIHYDPSATESPFVLSMFSANRAEWVTADMACSAYSLTSTALYDSLGASTSKYILSSTESPIVVCSKDKLKSLIKLKAEDPETLAALITLVSMDPLDPKADEALFKYANENRITLFDFDQVLKLGEINKLPQIPPKPETIYTISFTSGTTGANPKGVILTHKNAVCAITFCYSNITLPDSPTVYCFLPLAHIYERMSISFAISMCAAIGFPQSPSPITLMDDIKHLRPHFLNLVPRVYTKLEAALKAQTLNSDKPIIKSLFSAAINKKMELQAVEDGAEGRHIIYDQVVQLLRKKIGFDRLLAMTTGSAPISPETLKFIKASLNTGMSQGYGLTESFAGVCSSLKYEANPGSCGSISVTTEMRLREVPEMNYHAHDEGGPRGELMLRGPQIFKEYFKNPEETAKAIDSEGWFATGDIARIDSTNGNRIYIIDRVKNFFKLAQGEYITPEKIENTYLSQFPFLQQLYVHGDPLKTHLVAIVGLDPATIDSYIKRRFNDILSKQEDITDFFRNPKHRLALLEDMNSSVGGLLQGYEKIHNIKVDFNPLTIEDNVITPTLKIKRPIAAKFFKEDFDALYEEGSLIKPDIHKL